MILKIDFFMGIILKYNFSYNYIFKKAQLIIK